VWDQTQGIIFHSVTCSKVVRVSINHVRQAGLSTCVGSL